MDALSHESAHSESAENLQQTITRRNSLLPWAQINGVTARGRLFFVACLLLICGTAVFIGVVPTQIFGHDDFFLLDNGWRVVCGLRPHLDFYSPWGPLTFLIVGLGMVLSNASPNAIGYGSAIVGLVVGLWGYRLGRGRLDAVPSVLFGLFLALLVTAPYALGTWPLWSTHAMVYNRYGFALVGLVLVECLQHAESKERDAGEFVGGLSTGTAMALALFLKASYFAVCVPIVIASLMLRRPTRERLCGLAAGFGVVALAFLAYLRFDILRITQDLRIAAAGRSKMMELNPPAFAAKFAAQIPSLLLLILLFAYRSSPRGQAGRWYEKHQLPIWGGLVFIADAMLMFSNMQPGSMPLVAAFGIVVASRMSSERRRGALAESLTEKHRYFFLLLLCGMLSLPQICFDLVGLGYGAVQKAHPAAARSLVRFSSPRIASVILYDEPSDPRANGSLYTAYVNEGVALLKQSCGSGDRVITMDMVNPFPYALGWQPARGGMAAAAHNNLFSDEPRPSDQEYFGDATAVMVPKAPALNRFYYDGYFRIYYPPMLERFQLAAESESWRLYKLK